MVTCRYISVSVVRTRLARGAWLCKLTVFSLELGSGSFETWMRAPVSCCVFLITTPPRPITAPTAELLGEQAERT